MFNKLGPEIQYSDPGQLDIKGFIFIIFIVIINYDGNDHFRIRYNE